MHKSDCVEISGSEASYEMGDRSVDSDDMPV